MALEHAPLAEHNQAIAFAQEASLGTPGSLRDIADYLLSEGTGIVALSMKQLAARTYTSKTTLVRFAQHAGYAGWNAYRHDFLVGMQEVEGSRAVQAEVDVNYPFDQNATADQITDALARIQQVAVSEVRKAVDVTVVEQAARAVLGAHKVAFVGVMQNRERGRIFSTNLGLMGILCHVPTYEQTLALPQQLSVGDCAVVASYSGDLMHKPLSVVEQLAKQGVCVVAITNARRSQLGAQANHTLGFAPLEHLHDKIGPFYSGACTSLLLDLLYAACYAARYEQSSSRRNELLRELGDMTLQNLPGERV